MTCKKVKRTETFCLLYSLGGRREGSGKLHSYKSFNTLSVAPNN
jgi:hypothetical protein